MKNAFILFLLMFFAATVNASGSNDEIIDPMEQEILRELAQISKNKEEKKTEFKAKKNAVNKTYEKDESLASF